MHSSLKLGKFYQWVDSTLFFGKLCHIYIHTHRGITVDCCNKMLDKASRVSQSIYVSFLSINKRYVHQIMDVAKIGAKALHHKNNSMINPWS